MGEPESGDGLTAAQVVDLLGLAPLPREGGMWAQHWRDANSNAIYFLMQPGDFSAMHRLDRPELWHHYAGASVEMLLLDPDGGVRRPRLGADLRSGERPVVAVEAAVWMGARTTGDWSLVGTSMAPAFEPAAFELGDGDELALSYPEAADDIRGLVRDTPP